MLLTVVKTADLLFKPGIFSLYQGFTDWNAVDGLRANKTVRRSLYYTVQEHV